MSRWMKLLLLVLVVAGVGLLSLPWWLGAALRPVLQARGITFERYERAGYAHFRLHGVHYTNAGFGFTARQVQSLTPLAWLGQRLRGAEPSLLIADWQARRAAGPASPSNEKQINGLLDLQSAVQRIGPRVGYWLPQAHLSAGELHGFGPVLTIAQADWKNATLSVDGLHVMDLVVAFVLAPAPNGTMVLTAHTVGNEARLHLVWSGAELKGEAVLWDQTAQLSAHFPSQGWIPTEASAVAENWRLPATRLKLKVPYAWVMGDGRLIWRDGAFDLSLNAKAAPAADTKAPPFEASAAAHGNLRELTLTALHVDAPFATAKLTAPVTFSLDQPLASVPAQLIIQADLARLPWLEARGKAEGTVTVTSLNAAARQDFDFKFTDIAVQNFALKAAQASGVLQWPQLVLTELKLQLDETSSLEAHGAVNWQTRELTGVAVKAKLGPVWFARWLPAGASWESGEVAATAEGPLAALRHQGSLKLRAAQWPPLQPLAVDATWQGGRGKVEFSATAKATNSTLEFAGTLDPHGLQLGKLSFTTAGLSVWQLALPAQLTWAPTWQVDNLQLAGPDSQLAFKGKSGAEGFIELTTTRFDSAWLQDWVALTGPGWQVHTLKATGQVANGVLVFETGLTAQIEMSPRPAQVKLLARGDVQGIQLKELKVVDGERVLTQATGRLPLTLVMGPVSHLSFDDAAPLELSASTETDSPLWAALASFTGLELDQPEAKASLKGSLHQLAGELQLKVARLGATPGRFKFPLPDFSDLVLALQFGRDRVTITTFSAKLDGQSVQGRGQLPMDDGHWQQLWRKPAAFDWGKAEARLEVPDADLAAVARRFPAFVAAQGRLRALVELKAGGKFSGELHLTDAASRPLPPFGTLQEIKANLMFADRTITVQNLTATLGGEPVSVEGNATFEPGGTPRLALSLKGKNLPLVRNTGLLLRTDVDLHANTDAAGVTRLGGAVEVRDCLMLASLNLRALLPTGTRGVTRPPPYFSVKAEPFLHWLLAVEVQAKKSIRLRTTVFHGTASAHFRLDGLLSEPRAIGELTMDQGQLLFPFATFKVQSGTVRLREADPFHAIVNLTATSQRRDYQLRLEATGELPSPNVQLSSTPSLDASELTLLVMTGQPPVGAAGSSSGQRLALLGAYLSRGLFQDLGIGGEERLEISAGERVSEQGRDTYEFEYKLRERSSLLGEYDRFDSYNAGLKWRVYNQESIPPEKINPFLSRPRRTLFIIVALICTASLPAAELHVRGLNWFANRKAEQQLKLLRGEQPGATLDAGALEDAALVLISALNDEGYLAPGLMVEITRPDGRAAAYPLDARLEHPLPRPLDVTTATLRIARGRRFTLREVTFSGLLSMKEKEARTFFLGEVLLVPLPSERIYSPGRLKRAMGNLEEALRQQGYAEAEVTPGGVQIDPLTGKVHATIEVNEGRRWLVTTLHFSLTDGSAPPAKLIELRPDQPWTSLWRQDTMTAIRRWYFALGHPDVQVNLTPQAVVAPDGTKSVTVLAKVTPGPEVHVGQVLFTGNNYTHDAILRRLVQDQPGDLLDPTRFDNSQARISQLGVFRNIDLRYAPPDAATRDVIYQLTEGRRQEVSLLAGYGSYEQFRAGVEWRHYNLFGRAHTSSLKLVESMKSSQGDYIYTVPELFGSTTDGSARIFGLRRQELSFVREEYGANLSLLWPLRRLGVALTTGYTFKHLRNSNNELATSATDQKQADVASINLGVVREQRDNPLRPRKGYNIHLQVESANHALGGEVIYQQVVFGASYHTGWGNGRWFHAGLSQGVVTTFGAPDDSTLPVSVRFYPGGDGSIRGYQKGQAAPRAPDGQFIGAKAYTLFNLELEQALTTKWSVVVFGDALGTAARMADYPFSEKLYSLGLGVRYQTIIGPVRVEYGHNLNPRPFDPAGTLLFSIGFPF